MTNVTTALTNTISISQFENNSATKIFNEVKKSGAKVVMHNNEPECVLLSPSEYLSLMAELNKAKSMLDSDENDVIFDLSMTLSEEEMLKRLGITQEELDEMEEEELE